MAKAKQRLTKRAYQARAQALRASLVELQVELKSVPFKVLFIVAGPEGAGRGSLLNTLAEWLDPRGVETFSYHAPSEEEQEHPHQWRFWRSDVVRARPGRLAGEFLLAYALARAIGEVFREPDASLILGLSRGTFYSLFLIAGGLWLILQPSRPLEAK